MTHLCVGNLTIIGSDNDLSPGRRQVIIWTNAGILLIGPLGTNFSEIQIGIQAFSYKKMHLQMSSVKWLPFCLGFSVLTALVKWATKYPGLTFCDCVSIDDPVTHKLWYSRMFICVNLVKWGYQKVSSRITLHWRHNGRDGVSNHQPYDCLLNRLFRRRSKKTSKLCVLAFVRGIHRGPVNSPHKWPVTRKMFPFDDVIMTYVEFCRLSH